MGRAPWTDGSSYELDLDRALEQIRRSGARRVGLQAPEGLKRTLPGLARLIEEQTGAGVIISGDPCYGACDLDLSLCREVDLLLHLGHAKLGEPGEKVVFMEARMGADLRHAVERAVPLLKEKRVGLTTTVQHLHKLGEALAALRDHGVEGVVGPACGRAGHPGQVLGCCYCSARGADVREHLFIGTGQFHPLGVALATGKRVVAADPITGEALEVDPKPMLRRRFASIARAKDAKRVAVLVSKKPGQMRWDLARRLKEMGEAGGMEMHLVYMENIEPERLLNLGIEAAVFTACPRVALDDSAKFGIPVLTPPEFEILLGEREDYSFDEMEGNLGGG